MNEINKINPFLSSKTINQSNQVQTEKQPEQKPKADLPNLPQGVSKFEIDGNQVTLYKRGDRIDMQVVGSDSLTRDEIFAKVKEQLDFKENG